MMDVARWIARNADRITVQGRAVYRQGRVKGSWTVIDLSENGLRATGPLKDLDAEKPVDVRVEVDGAAFIARVERRWVREAQNGVAHGWEVLSVREASQRRLNRILAAPPKRGLHSSRFGDLLGIA